MTLEELLKMKIDSVSPVTQQPVQYSPDFRMAVQGECDDGVHVIIHAYGHSSETLDFVVVGNELRPLGS